MAETSAELRDQPGLGFGVDLRAEVITKQYAIKARAGLLKASPPSRNL